MNQHLLSILPLVFMLIWVAVEDARTRRIRNWLTVSIALSGLMHAAMFPEPVSPAWAVWGMVVGFALPLAMFVLGAIGGGDVKLLAGVGAWFGAVAVFKVFCLEAVVGMVLVLCQAAAAGRLKTLGRNSAVLAINLVHLNDVGMEHTKLTGQSCRSVDKPLPFAVPVLAAVVILLAGGWV